MFVSYKSETAPDVVFLLSGEAKVKLAYNCPVLFTFTVVPSIFADIVVCFVVVSVTVEIP